ncbi:threonine ammonia-lyase [Candidatus Uabimicrobium amorphum]|uniref:Serine/threonine dehydratase n=1 Tax=Uabimicrobium amorphum TaxID=2596890 RepID=A0A5S9IIB3_UABAM|nr:threonine/serine dehydratase [Candidatus Uabimicrobium amorphum]BBM82368.1 serine/threonine dehydratase [Candidatus Uabimicrobium amorphum]
MQLPTVENFLCAYDKIGSVVTHTPVVKHRDDVFLKPEIHQVINSFKIRGVFHAVSQLSEKERQQGISTVSAGNTAQALAWSGRYFGVPAYSIMPDTAPQTKIDMVKKYGGTPMLVSMDEVFAYLKEQRWNSDPYAFIHPWTNRDVMMGHGSIGIEILRDMKDVNSVFVPVGGGGLIAGVAGYIKQAHPHVQIYAVEPLGCPALHTSIQKQKPSSVECQTICDGVAVPYITEEMYPLLAHVSDKVVLVTEEDVKKAIRTLAIEHKMIIEPSGALAFAAALQVPQDERGKCVCILTGGSIDMDKFVKILQE